MDEGDQVDREAREKGAAILKRKIQHMKINWKKMGTGT